ncbi:ankyrin repeat and SOCS box protein 17 [Myripristis murdjan]|uniref:Ankyrin repeat and SOCS box containing 17 n=1 Tax=Myripristis murdjan TaxID=586833 RepID=A0A668A9T2_9TELE|nr:ankyrin repeat and SOCS box protein 17 [Myripristis murdjan]
MNDRDTAEGHSHENVSALVAQVLTSRPVGRLWARQPTTQQPGLYRILDRFFHNITAEQLEAAMGEFMSFARSTHVGMGPQRYLEFINLCTNIILYSVCARRNDARNVRTVMEIICAHVQSQRDPLALTWRCFTPVYSPVAGMTPLMHAAKNRQFDVLKVLLQYGMLERERRPSYIIIAILFYPPCVEDENLSYETWRQELKDCMALCFRVLTCVSVGDIESQIIHGLKPLIEDWRDCIPRNRSRDPCELSHLCRAVIRRSLLDHSLLPAGISALPLPLQIQNYLNLEW